MYTTPVRIISLAMSVFYLLNQWKVWEGDTLSWFVPFSVSCAKVPQPVIGFMNLLISLISLCNNINLLLDQWVLHNLLHCRHYDLICIEVHESIKNLSKYNLDIILYQPVHFTSKNVHPFFKCYYQFISTDDPSE